MTNEEAIKKLKKVQAEFNGNWIDYGGINKAFEKAYQALAERQQGEWIANPLGDYVCNKCSWVVGKFERNFCPNCGAKMQGGAEE